MGDGLDDLGAQLLAYQGKELGQRRIAAPYLPLRSQHQHAVAHGIQHRFQLGRLIRRVAHLAFDIAGHAVDGLHQGRKFLPRQTAEAPLEIAQGNGLHHINHGTQGTPQGPGKEDGHDNGHHSRHSRHLKEHRQPGIDGVPQDGQRQGKTQDAPVAQGAGGIGKVLPQGTAVPDGKAGPRGRRLAHFRAVTVIVHAFRRQPVGTFQQHPALRIHHGTAHGPVAETLFHPCHAPCQVRAFFQKGSRKLRMTHHDRAEIFQLPVLQKQADGKQAQDARGQRHG